MRFSNDVHSRYRSTDTWFIGIQLSCSANNPPSQTGTCYSFSHSLRKSLFARTKAAIACSWIGYACHILCGSQEGFMAAPVPCMPLPAFQLRCAPFLHSGSSIQSTRCLSSLLAGEATGCVSGGCWLPPAYLHATHPPSLCDLALT